MTNCGKFLEKWEYQTILSVFWEICMQVQKQQIEPLITSILRKENYRAVCCHLVCLTYTLSTSWKMPSWNQDRREKHQQPQICRWYHSNGRKRRGTKSLMMWVKTGSERASLRLNFKKPKVMASAPITSWQIKEEKVKVVTDFLFLDSKITADGDWSHEIRRQLLLGRKVITNLDSVLKSRLYSADKGLYSQDFAFPSGHVWLWELHHKEGRAL